MRSCDHGRMKRKQQFLRAVQIVAPGDQFTLNAAKRVPEESMPAFPGGAALQLVVALQKLNPTVTRQTERAGGGTELSMSHALRIKSAHYWLELGEVDQALLELGALSTTASNHPLAVKARVAVLQAVRRQNEAAIQE